MAESVIKNYFPSQTVSDAEKLSYDYGLKVAKAIEQEWFNGDKITSKYRNSLNDFHRLRLYARGEQSIQKYKDELSINGDLSYLNLDWSPVPIIPKFVDIVVNGIAERTYDIKAYSQDPNGVAKRTRYMESIMDDMEFKDLNDLVSTQFNLDLRESEEPVLPQTIEELQLHMQLNYKQAVELAEEQALNVLLDGNKYELTKKRFFYDLTVLGIGAVKNNFSTSEGITIDYVDPADLVYSYTDSPYFDDIYYVGEVKDIYLNELKKEFPQLTDEQLKEYKGYSNTYHQTGDYNSKSEDENAVSVLYFEYKTYMSQVHKIKKTASGGYKAIQKDDSFNPPENDSFEKVDRVIEVVYCGVKILGSGDDILYWEVKKNMMRPKADTTKAVMSYAICAPRM